MSFSNVFSFTDAGILVDTAVFMDGKNLWFDDEATQGFRILFDGGTSLDSRVPVTTGNFRWFIGATQEMSLGATNFTLAGVHLVMSSNHIEGVDYVEFDDANPADTGKLRLSNFQFISWRNQPNTFNHTFMLNSDDEFQMTTHLRVQVGYIEVEEIAVPAVPLTADGRIFLDTADDTLKFIHSAASGKGTVSLEGSGGSSPPFDDNQDLIQDNLDNTKVWRMTLDPITTGNTKTFSFVGGTNATYTFQSLGGLIAALDLAQTWSLAQTFTSTATFNGQLTANGAMVFGNATTDLITGTGRFNRDLIPNTDSSHNLGNADPLAWSSAYIDNVRNLTGLFFTTAGTSIEMVSSNLEIECSSTNDILIQENGAVFVRFDGGTNICAFQRPVTIDQGETIKSDGTAEIGIYVNNSGAAVGGFGTLKIPLDSGGESTSSQANTDFGAVDGAIGIYGRTGSDPFFCVRSAGTWYGHILNLSI